MAGRCVFEHPRSLLWLRQIPRMGHLGRRDEPERALAPMELESDTLYLGRVDAFERMGRQLLGYVASAYPRGVYIHRERACAARPRCVADGGGVYEGGV